MAKTDIKGDLLATMRSRMNVAVAAYGDSRAAELDDLREARARVVGPVGRVHPILV